MKATIRAITAPRVKVSNLCLAPSSIRQIRALKLFSVVKYMVHGSGHVRNSLSISFR